MRITVTTIDCTPEELATSPQLNRFLAGERTPAGPVDVVGHGASIPDDIAEFIQDRSSGGATRQRVERVVSEVLAWDSTEAAVGTSERSADGRSPYLMLRRLPRRVGAFAYLKPRNGGMTLRLTEEDIEGLELLHAYRNDSRPSAKYQINCPLRDDGAIDEALQLLHLAYEKAAG